MSWNKLKTKINQDKSLEYDKLIKAGYSTIAVVAKKLEFSEKYTQHILQEAYKNGLVDKKVTYNGKNRITVYKML